MHGVVVREDPDVDRVVLDDDSGQRIIMPMKDMRRHFKGLITYDEFRDTWTVINAN